MEKPGSTEPTRDLTGFLNDLARGRVESADTLLPMVYDELRDIASAYLRRQPIGHTLQPTELIHEAFLKLFDPRRVDLKDRKHFFALAARVMRQILVDHARGKKRLKCGAGRDRVTLHDAIPDASDLGLDVLDLDLALQELTTLDERQARAVELRYFGGLEVQEVAEVLGVSKSTVEREWRVARAWLGVRLEGLAS